MSIQSEITLLQNTKDGLRTAIMEKGVVVGANELFSNYPTRISQITTQSGTFDESLKKLLDGSYTSYSIPEGTSMLRQNAFNSYTSLTSITIPTTITFIGDHAFYNCTSLNRVNISDLSAWCKIVFSYDYEYSSNPLSLAHKLYLNGTLITELVIPSSITVVNDLAFYSNTSLTSVVIPDSVELIGGLAFSNCNNIKTVEIGEGVTHIGSNAFAWCSKLTSITIKATTPPQVENNTFSQTNNCPIYVPEDSVDAYKAAWTKYADRIQAIRVPAMKWVSPDGTYEISIACEDLATAGTLAKSERTAADPGNLMGSGEGSAEIGDCVTTIGLQAFYNCIGLTSITIPDSVTTIGQNAFLGCAGLTSVTIPNSVTSIGDNAFHGCTSLTSVTVNSTTPPTFGSGVFYSTNDCPIIVPVESVDAYKAATGWSYYSDRIVGEGVPYWKLISSECETDGSGKNTGYVTNTYEDANPSSSTYGNIRSETVQDEITCPITVVGTEFTKITSLDEATSGKYLIVDTANNIALNASLIASTTSTANGINAFGNHISVGITDDTIEATDTTLNAAVDYDGENKTLSWTDENTRIYYLWPANTGANFNTSTSNPQNFVTPYLNTTNGGITFKASNSSTRAIALFTNTSNNSKFRWQPTNTDSNFDNVALFKYVEE